MATTPNTKCRTITLLVYLLVVSLVLASGCSGKSRSDAIDFSNSDWLDGYMDAAVELYMRDFTQFSAFSCSDQDGKFVVVYASRAEVEATREFYREQYAAVESGRNDSSALNLSMELEAGSLNMVNYYSRVSQVYELELRPDPEFCAAVREQMEAAFPAEIVERGVMGTDLLAGAPYGAYVRYLYDDLDNLFQQNTPIFSRAFVYGGTAEDFQRCLDTLSEKTEASLYDETQETHYFRLEEGVLGVSLMRNEAQTPIAIVSIQLF